MGGSLRSGRLSTTDRKDSISADVSASSARLGSGRDDFRLAAAHEKDGAKNHHAKAQSRKGRNPRLVAIKRPLHQVRGKKRTLCVFAPLRELSFFLCHPQSVFHHTRQWSFIEYVSGMPLWLVHAFVSLVQTAGTNLPVGAPSRARLDRVPDSPPQNRCNLHSLRIVKADDAHGQSGCRGKL